MIVTPTPQKNSLMYTRSPPSLQFFIALAAYTLLAMRLADIKFLHHFSHSKQSASLEVRHLIRIGKDDL